MKKIFFLLFGITISLAIYAQEDSLKQYVGKYKFPEGNPVTEMVVTLADGALTAGSIMGSSALKKVEGDVFEIVAYGGIATFKRDTEGKIVGVEIKVGDINMEGKKSDGLSDLMQHDLQNSCLPAKNQLGWLCFLTNLPAN